MKHTQLFEQAMQYDVRLIPLSDVDGLQAFADFYNESGQLTWQLTPSRLKQKVGSKGKLWGLYPQGSDEIVGTIGLKTIQSHNSDTPDVDLGEIGYVMVDSEHRSLQNVMKMFKVVLAKARKFDAVYITTNVKNKTINKLLDRTPKTDKILLVKSPFGGGQNKLVVYMVNTTKSPNRESLIKDYFSEYTISEY